MSTFKRALILMTVNIAGCAGGMDSCSGCDGDAGVTKNPAQEATEPLTTATAQTGSATAERGNCVEFDFTATRRWPRIAIETEQALARWGKELPVGENCRLVIYASDKAPVARTFSGNGFAGMHINPGAGIIQGEICEGKNLRLADVITHELGHVYGYSGHSHVGAMSQTNYCTLVFPTREELTQVGAEIGVESFVGPVQ